MSTATSFASPRFPFTANGSLGIASANIYSKITGAVMKEFPPYRLDTLNQCLWRCNQSGSAERIPLMPKPYAVLRYLVDQAARLVTQDELLDAVWPDTNVQPEALKGQICEIRQVLADNPKNPRFIATYPRRGYQFIAQVNEVLPNPALSSEQPARKLVGRDVELGRLLGSLQTALLGQRQVVFVTGENGIGKTALIDEFHQQAFRSVVPLLMGRGQCVESYGGKEAYYPMLEALSQLCLGVDGDAVIQVLARQAPTWLVQFPSLVRAKDRAVLQLEIQGATRERMLREISEALETIASIRPMLLIFEDLQFADPATVDLISALARRRQLARLLLIGSYRQMDIELSCYPLKMLKQDLLIRQLCREITLEALDESQVGECLAAESGGLAVSEEMAGLIYRHTEGNPLFIMAVLEDMKKRKIITQKSDGLSLNLPLDDIELRAPETLRQMIELQIEQLTKEEQLVLEVASVIGNSFSVALGATMANMDAEKFEGLCERLARRHQIIRLAAPRHLLDGSVSQRYEFVHALYMEVLLLRQSSSRRSKLEKHADGS